jgi:hypothetical protein
MSIGDSTLSRKNKLILTIPEIPKDTNEQNHTENGYENIIKSTN